MEEFYGLYQAFLDDFLELNVELRNLIGLRPINLPRFPSLLEIGSKLPTIAYPDELLGVLWDKLVASFPNPTFNGLRIPSLGAFDTFLDAFPVRGVFPLNDFLPLIAVAYGYASSFADQIAQTFTIDRLFYPNFGPQLSSLLLEILKDIPSLGDFARFGDIDLLSGLPFDSIGLEIFR